MYNRKTTDEFEIQANHGHGEGYEVETTETTRKEANKRLKEYRENAPNASYKIVKKRVPINLIDKAV